MANIIKTKHLANASGIEPIRNMERFENNLSSNPNYFTHVDEFGWINYIKLNQQPDTSRCGCQRPNQSCALCRTEQEKQYFRIEKATQLKDEEDYYDNDFDIQEVYDEL